MGTVHGVTGSLQTEQLVFLNIQGNLVLAETEPQTKQSAKMQYLSADQYFDY